MTPRRRTLSERWTAWYLRVLPAYWVFLFISTHFPKMDLKIPMRSSDKMAHFVAFGLLAFLFWRFAEALYGQLSGRFVWTAAASLIVYAAIDEWLQQFVGRHTDLMDFLWDSAGVIVVLAALETHRRLTTHGTFSP